MSNIIQVETAKYFLPVFQPLVYDTHRYELVFGGRGPGKSVNAGSRKIIFKMQSDGRNNALVCRKNEKDNAQSTYKELKKAILAYGALIYDSAKGMYIKLGEYESSAINKAKIDESNYLGLWKYNTSPLKITYMPCGNSIIFRGFNDPESIKSITTDIGYFTMGWIEEAQQIERRQDFDDVDNSFRGLMPDGLFFQWVLTFNSPLNTHWLKEMTENASIKVNFPRGRYITEGYENYTYKSISAAKGTDKDVLAHYSVYKDNPFLSEEDKIRYEKKKVNPQNFEWDMLGEFGSTTGRVFNNWEIKDFDIQDVIKPPDLHTRSKFKIIGGLDFGYVHPWAFYMVAINKEDKECYIFDGFSAIGLKNHEVASKIIEMGYNKEKIICENAEPRTVQDLRDYGLRNLKTVKKYKGNSDSSIMQGIKLMMEYKYYIKPELIDMIKGFSNYIWDCDKFGNTLERPISTGDDEVTVCMTKDTLILTKEGYKTIDTIKKDDIVMSYNEKENKFEYNKVRECGLTKRNTKILKLTLEDGTEIKLTPNHRLLTTNGWKKAKNISENDEIICMGVVNDYK